MSRSATDTTASSPAEDVPLLSILCVDDHDLIRVGLRHMLEARPDVGRVVEATRGEEALQHILAETFDAIVLDLQLPGISGLETARFALEQNPHQRVLVLSAQLDAQRVKHLLEVGVLGVLSKSCDGRIVGEALDEVLAGRCYLSPDVPQDLVSEVNPLLGEPQMALSPREKEICIHLMSGLRNQQVAALMGISEKTVSTHRARAFSKLDVRSVAELTQLALQLDLFKPEDVQPS